MEENSSDQQIYTMKTDLCFQEVILENRMHSRQTAATGQPSSFQRWAEIVNSRVEK
jgi:hypothetical protein